MFSICGNRKKKKKDSCDYLIKKNVKDLPTVASQPPETRTTCPRACMFERCVCVGLGAHTDVSYQTVRRLRSFLWQCKSKQSRWRNARCKRKSSETTNNLNVSLSSLAFLTNYSHMQHTHTHTEDKETDSNNARAPPLQLLCNFTARRGEKKKKKERVPFLILLVLGVLTENSPMPLYLQSCAE